MVKQASILGFTKKRKQPDSSSEEETSEARQALETKRQAQRKRALQLLGSLTDEEWRSALEPEADERYLYDLASFVFRERGSRTIYPPDDLMFAALNACPLAQVKVVIVGQDPYHGPGQANGLAFSIAPGATCTFPPSLRNILNELRNDENLNARIPPKAGDLRKWASRGVLLLNTVLTVRGGAANSHRNNGWEPFTDAIINAVNTRQGPGAVFLLWGKSAEEKCSAICRRTHRVHVSSHPSPLATNKRTTRAPFKGSKFGSKCNAYLTELGYDELMDWSLV